VVKLGIPFTAVAAIPAPYLMSIELNDGYLKAPPGMDLVTETTCHRAFCGEGEFDVRGFVDTLRKVYAGPWGMEVLNKAQRAGPLDELREVVDERRPELVLAGHRRRLGARGGDHRRGYRQRREHREDGPPGEAHQ
jgi:hypothetical protein